jgi:hypothetical protein
VRENRFLIFFSWLQGRGRSRNKEEKKVLIRVEILYAENVIHER